MILLNLSYFPLKQNNATNLVPSCFLIFMSTLSKLICKDCGVLYAISQIKTLSCDGSSNKSLSRSKSLRLIISSK